MVSQGSVDRASVFGIMADAWVGPKVGVFAILNHTDDQAEQAELEFAYLRDMSKNWHNVKVRDLSSGQPQQYALSPSRRSSAVTAQAVGRMVSGRAISTLFM